MLERTKFAHETFPKQWPSLSEFPDIEIMVDVIRLDAFVKEHGIERIDHLHVDAQGADMDVLKSLGEAIAIVQGGEIEIATRGDMVIYEGQSSLDQAVFWLDSKGFRVGSATPNGNNHELNVRFYRA